jgi:hypothetical protein
MLEMKVKRRTATKTVIDGFDSWYHAQIKGSWDQFAGV